MSNRAAIKEWRLDQWLRERVFYLVLLGNVLLMVLLHLPELGLQTTELNFHLLYILQVPLRALVQHLDGLGHVLDLRCTGTRMVCRNCHLQCNYNRRRREKKQQTFNMLRSAWRSPRSDSQTLTSGQLVRGLGHMVQV